MTNTQLVVLPASTAVQVYEMQEEDQEILQETLDSVLEEIADLDFRLTSDKERVETFINKVNKGSSDIISQIELVNTKLQLRMEELRDSDDLEDQLKADALKDSFAEDTDHETRDNEQDADAMAESETWSRFHLTKKCREVYKLIAAKTHPDKCRHLSDEERARRTQIFLEAKTLVANLDYEALSDLYIRLLQGVIKKASLMDRLISARNKRENLAQSLVDLHSSEEWQLYLINLRHGYDIAEDQYRNSLLQTLHGLLHLLASLDESPANSNTTPYWA